MGWGYHGFYPFFGWLFFPFGFLAVLLVFRLIFGRRWGWGRHGCGCGGYGYGGPWHDGGHEAEAILQRRLASGEIDEAEYRRVKEILRG